jgi:hypothetical protein
MARRAHQLQLFWVRLNEKWPLFVEGFEWLKRNTCTQQTTPEPQPQHPVSSAENKNGRKGKTYVSTVIDAPIEAVWATARRFADLSWAGLDCSYHRARGFGQASPLRRRWCETQERRV